MLIGGAFFGDATMEIWKPIPGSKYEASSLGRIRSPRGNILKPYDHKLGYHLVGVKIGESYHTRTVHSLVAAAFHGPRPEGLDVAHGNCVKTDNRASNLRYATRSENLLDSVMLGNAHGFAYPWRVLSVGETFASNPVGRDSIVQTAGAARRRTGFQFSVAKAANDDGSWTVTRVA